MSNFFEKQKVEITQHKSITINHFIKIKNNEITIFILKALKSYLNLKRICSYLKITFKNCV